MNRRTRKIAALFAGVLVATSLGAADCKNQDGLGSQPGHDPQPNKQKTTAASTAPCKPMVDPAVPPNLDKKRYITIWTCLEPEFGPYTVTYHAADGITGKTLAATDEDVVDVARPFNRIIGYDSGQKVTITVDVRPARAGSKNGYIIARDGVANTKKVTIDGGWTAKLQINASR